MTEKKAWLEIAKMFDSVGPTWNWGFHIIGICHATGWLRDRLRISVITRWRMDDRLKEHFKPNDSVPSWGFYWAYNRRRPTRNQRATACCFLAAMCDD